MPMETSEPNRGYVTVLTNSWKWNRQGIKRSVLKLSNRRKSNKTLSCQGKLTSLLCQAENFRIR